MTARNVLSLVLGLAAMTATFADNGEIALAYPVGPIEIDGDLADWPERARSYPLERYNGRERSARGDFEASFRVGYDATARALYVAGVVLDDSRVVATEDSDWQSQDSWLLYLDRQHSPNGSGNRLYQTGERLREIGSPAYGRDPVNSGATWDEVDVAVKHADGTTTYEWRFPLGEFLEPWRSIGIDHLLNDTDPNEDNGTTARWGNGWGKSGRSGSLADVLLLPADTEHGTVTGKLAWADDIPDDLPDRVRLQLLDHPALWTQAEVDSKGRYEAQLPTGTYRISSAHRLTEPNAQSGTDNQRRIDTRATTEVTVVADQIVEANRLDLRTYVRPDYLLSESAPLLDDIPINPSSIDAYVEAMRRYYAIPGLTLAIVQDGKLAYHRTFGTKNALTGEPVEKNTLFEAASITKPLFAFAAMRLVERGKLDLDKPLHEYLPFENLAADERYKKMTARHVLSHQTGLDNWPWGGVGTFRRGDPTELNFTPGEGYGYSGEGTNYLARVVETITGKPIEQILQEETLSTMGMAGTHFSSNDTVIAHKSNGHLQHLPTFGDITDEASMASSMHTESTELAKFMIGLMQRKGLKPETYEEMWRPHKTLPEDQQFRDLGATDQATTLGFFARTLNGHTLIEHGGNNGDFQGIMIFCPEKKAGFAMLANTNVGHKMHYALFRQLLGSP